MSSKTANDLGNHIQKPNEIDTDDSNQNYCFAHLCYEITYIDLLVADFREMLCHFDLLVLYESVGQWAAKLTVLKTCLCGGIKTGI